jgi:hypothetical protein
VFVWPSLAQALSLELSGHLQERDLPGKHACVDTQWGEAWPCSHVCSAIVHVGCIENRLQGHTPEWLTAASRRETGIFVFIFLKPLYFLLVTFRAVYSRQAPSYLWLLTFLKLEASWALVAHACSPSYSGGRDQEDHGSKPAQANSL